MTVDLSRLVKPMVWEKHPSANIWRCNVPHGEYKVFAIGGFSWDYDSATSLDDHTSKAVESVECAIAAANADHAARVLASLDTALIEELVGAAETLLRYIPDGVVECRGDKCREPWCASCFGWDYADAHMEKVYADRDLTRATLAKLKGGA
ncbi:MAG: hypothetical protein MUD11_07440 [Rhodobacteraceae bacterium]|jgi:hypothetical protein|nr:hypothetical protein [Paracoccaceae bacterium]